MKGGSADKVGGSPAGVAKRASNTATQEKKPSARGKKKKDKKKGKRDQLKDGEMIKSEQFTWKVIRKLGSGGFGDVYKVAKVDHSDTQEYAMKTEMVEGNKRLLRLKIEVTVLDACRTQPDPDRKRHFVALEDKGLCEKFKFVVMGLVGPSLEDIRYKYLDRTFNKSTAMNAAQQTLKSLADLHFIGWLHRDIKPQNFAVGLGETEEIVYMLDFGIARSVYNPGTRIVKNPRAKVKFLGTVRYASIACHKQIEQGRRDDLETWLYMVVDLFDDEKGLSWRSEKKCNVLKEKEKFFDENFTFKGNVPQELRVISRYIASLRYEDEPDYAFLTKALEAVAHDAKIDTTKKPEWLGKLKQKMKKEEAEEAEDSTENQQNGSDEASDPPEQLPEQAKPAKKASTLRVKKAQSVRKPRNSKEAVGRGPLARSVRNRRV